MTALVQKNQLSSKLGWEGYITIFVMFLFTLFEFGSKGKELPVALVFGMSSISYFLILILYIGIALFAYDSRNWLLVGTGLAVYIVGFMFTGSNLSWIMFAQWSMILFGAIAIGRFTMKKEPPQKVYTIGLVAVLFFALILYLPLFSIITTEITNSIGAIIENIKTVLPQSGYSAEENASILSGAEKSLSFLARVLPSLMLLSLVLQYSIGYLLFTYLLSKRENRQIVSAPFMMWKMPYYLTIFLLIGGLLSFFGNEIMSRIGDNLLVFLSLFYAISGLSLMEYYLKKFKFHPFVKFSFYLFLLLTQLIGFFVTIIAGFIDSFKDFRNCDQLNLQNE